MGEQHHLGSRAHALAGVLVLREARRRRRIRDREIESVAGAHADGAEGPALRFGIGEIADGLVRRRRGRTADRRNRRARARRAVLRPAIVLRERDHDRAALLAAVDVAAPQALQVDIDAVEVAAHARDLAVEHRRTAATGLQPPNRKKPLPSHPRGGFARPCGRARPAGGSPLPRSGGSARRAPDRAAPAIDRGKLALRAGCRAGSDRLAAAGGGAAPGPGGQGCARLDCARTAGRRSGNGDDGAQRAIKRESIVASGLPPPRRTLRIKRAKGVENVNRNYVEFGLYTVRPRDGKACADFAPRCGNFTASRRAGSRRCPTR